MKWYVLYTKPRCEKKSLERLVSEGYRAYLPVYKSKRKWSDRTKIVELPLFNSYIFVNCQEYQLSEIYLHVPHVLRAVYFNGKPAIIKDNEIEAIIEFVKSTETSKIIQIGDIVDILSGPLEKQSGKIVKINDRYSYLYIEALDAIVCIEKNNLDKK
jgi:transcription antitermination factor NusG